MKNTLKVLGIIALVAVIGFGLVSCDTDDDGGGDDGGNDFIEGSYGDFTYYQYEGEVTIDGYNGPGGNVEIPAQINGKPVTRIDDAFAGCTSLTGVTIPNSVTSIGYNAFTGCTSLTGVTIPNSVTSIEGSAFYGCTSLTGITIPNSVTSIEERVFYGCTGLTSITIPNSVTEIRGNRSSNGAFNGCASLTSVTFQGTITLDNFGEYAFGDIYYGYIGGYIGDLRQKYLASDGGIGTYTRSGEGTDSSPYTWTKQS